MTLSVEALGRGGGRIRTQECIERSSFSSSVDSNLYQLRSLGVERGHKGDECFTYEFIYKIIKNILRYWPEKRLLHWKHPWVVKDKF